MHFRFMAFHGVFNLNHTYDASYHIYKQNKYTRQATIVDEHIISHISRFTAIDDSAIVDIATFGFIVTGIFKVRPITRIIFNPLSKV